MSRRGTRKLAVCQGCHQPFVVFVIPFISGTIGLEGEAYHETHCTPCRTEHAVAVHLNAAKRMAAKVPAQRRVRDQSAMNFKAKHPDGACVRCAAGKSCSILSRERNAT